MLKDTEPLKTSVKFPHVPQRRDGDNRVGREVEDLMLLFSHIDEHKLLDMLPIYVSAGPDCMPSIRLVEGDYEYCSENAGETRP